MPNNRPGSQVSHGAEVDYTLESSGSKGEQTALAMKQDIPERISHSSTSIPDFSKRLSNNVILTDALADVVVTGQEQDDEQYEAYFPQPIIVHAAPAVVPDATIAEIEGRLQFSSLNPADTSLEHFEGSLPNVQVRPSAILDDTLQTRNVTASRPVSEIYNLEALNMGPAFHGHMGWAHDGQYLSPNPGFEYDQESDRPRTAASTDTYHQAQTLFTDFDGAHYAPSVVHMEEMEDIEEEILDNRISSGPILMAPQMVNQGLPPPAPGMVFYPAPVPKTLLLPQRLSRAMPAGEQAKRRSQMLNALPADARKSAIWLNKNPIVEGQEEDPFMTSQKAKQRMSMLPPQLRASMFFENPSQLQEVEVRDKSAVATLDDLLDLSTVAPVSAFTDHPIAGSAGGNVYKREHKRTTSTGTSPRKVKARGSLLGLRRTSAASTDALNDVPKLKKHSRAFSLGTRLDDSALSRDENGDFVSTRSGASTPALHIAIEDEEDDEEDENDPDFDMPSDDDDPYARIGPPVTLLAELQLRKAALKTRNRTALTAFPNGMHATLLEMDAVAQIQQKKRRTARVTLAWEDPDRAKAAGFGADDDDVPLGALQAVKDVSKDKLREREIAEWDQPMGLIQMREREDTEPLAVRKARLRGMDPNAMRRQSHMRSMSGPLLQINGDAMGLEDEPEETLAQRVRRLKDQSNGTSSDGNRPISQAFSEEVLGQFVGHNAGSKENLDPEGEEEETLGQRRARLQREAQRQSQMNVPLNDQGQGESLHTQSVRPALRTTTSMADLLQNVPVGATRRVSEKNLLSSLPQDSLLRQSEEKKAARRDMMNGIRNAQRVPSGTFGGRPLLDMSGVDMSKHGIAPNGFRGGLFNNGFGGVGAQQPMGGSMVDLRQSMATLAAISQQNQMAMQMMQQNAAMSMPMQPMAMNSHMSMQLPMHQTIPMDPRMSMQPQMNPQMSMGMAAAAPRMSMNPYAQPGMGAFASTPNLMSGAGMPMTASTPNLMGGRGTPMVAPYARQQSTMSMPMAAPAQTQGVYVADHNTARIENWRQEIPMDSTGSTATSKS